jgi:hypothetical protein
VTSTPSSMENGNDHDTSASSSRENTDVSDDDLLGMLLILHGAEK